MYEMTESQATAEGLSVVAGLPVAPVTVVDRLTAASETADTLAAVVEALLSVGRVRRSDLTALSNGLGYLHVELDELADERRRKDTRDQFASPAVVIREEASVLAELVLGPRAGRPAASGEEVA